MTSIRNIVVGAIIVGSGLAAATVTLAAKPNLTEVEFKKMDTNKDGRVSSEEYAQHARQMFATLDADKDGKLTAAEMDAAYQRVTGKPVGSAALPAAEKIKAVDSDADGSLNVEEYVASSHAMFAKIDSNHDSFLSKEELLAAHAATVKKPAA
ncbi:MAG: EF-hand domain-containing protein [Pseudomonadota bacterium]